MSLIKGMGSPSQRGNPLRAFGDGVYLSRYWSEEAPSRHEVLDLLAALKKLGIYQLNYEGGVVAEDGTIKFPTNAEPFTWEADAWCGRQKYPMKFMAWVRNTRDGQTVSLATPGIMRNVVYCLNFFCMFRGLLFDMDVSTPDEQKAYVELLRATRETYPEMALAVRARRGWLERPDFLRSLLDLVGDIDIPLFGSTLSGKGYRAWCAEQTKKAVTIIGARKVMLTLPAQPSESETLLDALHGVKTGMKSMPPQGIRLALYREGSASDDDWKTFAREWVC